MHHYVRREATADCEKELMNSFYRGACSPPIFVGSDIPLLRIWDIARRGRDRRGMGLTRSGKPRKAKKGQEGASGERMEA